MTTRPAGRGLAALAAAVLLAACASATPSPKPACPTGPPTQADAPGIIGDTTTLDVHTSQGSFTIELDPSSAPIAVANLVALVECGFYDGQSFHRIVAGFVAQAGDPQTKANHGDFAGLGTGGPGYRFDIEFPPEDTAYTKYMVAMANGFGIDPNTGVASGADTNGSQWFVMLDDADFLPPYYSLLGEVVAGTDVVDAIGQVPTNGDPMNVPLDPVIIDEIAPGASPQPS